MNRRSFLCAAPTVVALTALPVMAKPEMTLEELCEYHISKLCDAMQQLHGGQWDSLIDHNVKCVFARRL